MAEYQKYERAINQNFEESLSKIVNLVSDGSVVLDVGCSSGMLGKYLIEKKSCVVDGVDADAEAIEICKKCYRNVFVKNLEFDSLSSCFEIETYDYIVVADVIEHLVSPDNLLTELKKLLKPDGVIIFSVPNITHLSVALELLFGDFHYEVNGLLDSTHLRFYSKQSFVNKANEFGLHLWALDFVYKDLIETEFGGDKLDLFPSTWLKQLISIRDDALTYQWIFSLKKYPNIEFTKLLPNNSKITRTPPLFTTSLFWLDSESLDFSSEHQLLGNLVKKTDGKTVIDFNFSDRSIKSKLKRLRVDPVSDQKPFLMVSAELLDINRNPIWSWELSDDCDDDFSGARLIKRIDCVGCLFQALSDDPQWYPKIDADVLSSIDGFSTFRVILIIDDPLLYLYHNQLVQQDYLENKRQNELFAQKQIKYEERIGELDKLVFELQEKTMAKEQAIARDRDKIHLLEEVHDELEKNISESQSQIEKLKNVLVNTQSQLAFVSAEKNEILNSTCWKVTRPIRYLRGSVLKDNYRLFRQYVSRVVRYLWAIIPVSSSDKQHVKYKLFNSLPCLFSWSRIYKDWYSINNKSRGGYYFDSSIDTHNLNDAEVEDIFIPLAYLHPPKNLPVRVIAFFLPQFHEIPENDEWWGKGFTEWTNVKPAQPQFIEHYQPHVPVDEIGHYSLLDMQTQQKQIELAKLHGIEAFCYYTYWFSGKLLLEKPVEIFLNNPNLDLSFCLCWANENWSRRWDGLDNEVLISQKYSDEDDLAFIQYVSQYMRDKRYFRINDKPLLLVYRPSLLPNAKETARRWRAWCIDNGIGEIYLAYTQSFETVNPSKYGFDAAIEFPPNNSSPPNITDQIKPLHDNFSGLVYDWKVFVERSRKYVKPNYQLFRGVCPSWDNTARRKDNGTVFLNSSPSGYKEWLENAIHDTCVRIGNENERLIFVNAWNEWAEGAHLEPDKKYGYAYLDATRKALEGSGEGEGSRKIIIVTHDAHPHGAQYLSLHMAQEFSEELGFSVQLVCLGSGILKAKYSQFGTFHDLDSINPVGPVAQSIAKNFYVKGYRFAIVNTTVSGLFLETLKRNGITCISLVHEQRGVIDGHKLHKHAQSIGKMADKVVFAAELVANEFQEIATLSPSKLIIRPQGLYKRTLRVAQKSEAKKSLRISLNLPENAKIVLGVGYADLRKGVDLFVEIGKSLVDVLSNTYMVWVGHWDSEMQTQLNHYLAEAPKLATYFIFPGRQDNTDLFYLGADAYALTSREDPFPSVLLEAMSASLPIVAFEGSGGFSDLLKLGCGSLVQAFNTQQFSLELGKILTDLEVAREMGVIGLREIREKFSFRAYLFDLLKYGNYPLFRVSVVVPNYNYGCFLTDRINTIKFQRYPVYEIIILDDCSTDNSFEIITEISTDSKINIRFIPNLVNSGSVFLQWEKGVQHATGDLVWIAEADDLSEMSFLDEVVESFNDTEVVMSYCESKQIDWSGNVISNSYFDYVADISGSRWSQPYVCKGEVEITSVLSIKNTIPNVSAVVFRKELLKKILAKEREYLENYKVAGDWYIYVKLLDHGKVAFSPSPLNLHRRHPNSVTNATFNFSQLTEIVKMQNLVATNYFVSDAIKAMATNYSQRLYEQFGLATKEFPRFEQKINFGLVLN